MALQTVCDQCGTVITGQKSAFTVTLDKGKGEKPAKVMHLAVVHRLPQANDAAHVCDACMASNLGMVIEQLAPKAAKVK